MNALKFAEMMKEYMRGKGYDNIKSLPYYRGDKINSFRWIVPEKTAINSYKYGKFFFQEDDGVLKIGVNVERGILNEVSDLFGKSLCLKKDWAWNKFLSDLESGVGDQIVTTACDRLDSLYIKIAAGVISPTSSKVDIPKDMLEFKVTSSLELIKKDTHHEHLDLLTQAKSMKELGKLIKQADLGAMVWVDLYIYTIFDKDHKIEEREIMHTVLDPLLPWFY